MEALLDSLLLLITSLWGILTSVIALIVPWTALIAWVAFWLFAVNWRKLAPILLEGGWVGVVLTYLVMILVWGVVAPPADGVHHLLGLTVSNFVGKTIYTTALFCIPFLCSTIQLSGCCAECCQFEEDEEEVVQHAAH